MRDLPRDSELDRLKEQRDRAFDKKQGAWQAQNDAWERVGSARDTMNGAFDSKRRAREAMDDAWQYRQQVRDRNNPRIDQLFGQQESAYQRQRNAFDNASAAHANRDGASARRYADEGHAAKAECQQYIAERRRLVSENQAAKARHEATRPAWNSAKDAFDRAKSAFDRAKADHARKQAEFKQAKADYERADTAFRNRLGQVKAANERKRDDKRDIARRAGVPSRYLDNLWVSTDTDGNTNIYFGGAGEPNGPGHGHYVMDRNGKVTYKRDPFDPHGSQNFQRDERVEREMSRVAMNAWARQQTTKRQVQYSDGDYVVKAGSGYSRDRDAITTDIIIAERGNSKEHYHLVIDDLGNVVFSEWRKNH